MPSNSHTYSLKASKSTADVLVPMRQLALLIVIFSIVLCVNIHILSLFSLHCVPVL